MFHVKHCFQQVFHKCRFPFKNFKSIVVSYKTKNYRILQFNCVLKFENFHSFSTSMFHVKHIHCFCILCFPINFDKKYFNIRKSIEF